MDLKRITIVAVLLLVAVISFTKIAPWACNPDTHTHTIEQTDDKISTVIALSGGAAATSATLSLLPGDLCTPLSEQLAELAKYFLLILSALYFEKSLITLSGYITFSTLVPITCIISSAAAIFKKRQWMTIAVKIAFIALVLYLIVPASVHLSDIVYKTQESRIENTMNEYNNLDLEDQSETGILGDLVTITTDTVDKVTSLVSSFLESLAVMIVTACLIPLLVCVFLFWLVKTVFSSNVISLEPGTLDTIIKKLNEIKEKKDE